MEASAQDAGQLKTCTSITESLGRKAAHQVRRTTSSCCAESTIWRSTIGSNRHPTNKPDTRCGAWRTATSTADWTHGSADPRQRIAHQHVHYARRAQRGLHHHPAGMVRPHLTDDGRVLPVAMLPHLRLDTASASSGCTRATSLPSLATYSGSIPSISQAPRTSSRTGTLLLLDPDAHLRLRRQFIQRRGQPAPGGIAHARESACWLPSSRPPDRSGERSRSPAAWRSPSLRAG